MYDAKLRDDWQHTTTLSALLANLAYALRGIKRAPPTFESLYPFPQQPEASAAGDETADEGLLDIDAARRLWLRATNG